MNTIPQEQEIEYPTCDGQPMAETTLHREVMCDLIWGLGDRYADIPDIWVGGNLFLCYEKGNPSACIAPDVLMAKGVTKWDRPNYLLWDETPPSLIIEVTSLKTQEEDLYEKKPRYERIGVEEYLLFDPYGEYLRPRLQGHRLEGGRYQPIPIGDYDSLLSRTTGLTFRPEDLRLRMIDAATKKPLWRICEIAQELARAEARTRAALDWLAAEIEARQAAEAKIAGGREARRAIEERIRILEDEVGRLRRDRSG